MNRSVISIQGPQAVGKTTALRQLQSQLPGVHFDFENPYPAVAERTRLGLDINTNEGFVANQRLFIEAECGRYNNLPDGRIIMDRGPEDTECYTLTYPKQTGKNWDIETQMAEDLAKLRQCRSTHILYLCASPETLLRRKESDAARGRGSFDLKAFAMQEDWFRGQPQVEFMDVDAATPEQVARMILDRLVARWPDQQSGLCGRQTEDSWRNKVK